MSEFFVGINNIGWTDTGIVFDYIEDSGNVHIDLSETLADMESQILRTNAKLEQSEKMYSELLDKCLGFEILGDDLEDDGEEWKIN